MTQRKRLTTRPMTAENQLEMMNREVLPVIRQLTVAPVITGSRSGAPISILQQVMTALANAGIVTDNTTP